MSGLMVHSCLTPWTLVPQGDPAIVMANVVTPSLEGPGPRPMPLHQTSLWQPVRLEPSTQHHPTQWEVPQTGSEPNLGQLSNVQVQVLAKKQAVGFRLSTAQDDKMGWWNSPPSLSSLRQ